MKSLALSLLPKNLYSRFLGLLANLELPPEVLLPVLRAYSHHYGVDLESMSKPLEDYKSFNDFFTRTLAANTRSIDTGENVLCSPVDGKVTAFGRVEEGLLIQTKKIYYSLKSLLGEEHAQRFHKGWYIALYLSPGDYHRIHAPIDCSINECAYFDGKLWPVNAFGLEQVHNLYAINERIVSYCETDFGKVALVKVGALAAGKIKVRYHEIESNRTIRSHCIFPIQPAHKFTKGTELGHFELGSAVILLLEEQMQPRFLDSVRVGSTYLYGQALAELSGTKTIETP